MVRNVDSGAARVVITPPQQMSQRSLTLLERQLDDAIAQRASAVDMPLNSVQVIDSAGLNWLLNAKARLEVAGIPLHLMNLSDIVKDIFVATRMDSRFTIQQTPATVGERNA